MDSFRNRPDWKEYALRLAFTAAERSEDPYQRVGACALNRDRMVLGLGYNGLASGVSMPYKNFWENRDYRRKYMIHAEANCLSLCKKGEVDILASTLLPCSSCATMIAAYGVESVVYSELYKRDTDALSIFKFYNISVEQVKL